MAMISEDVTTSYLIDLIALEHELHQSLEGHVALRATAFGSPVLQTLRATCEAHLEKLDVALARKQRFVEMLVFGRPKGSFALDASRSTPNATEATDSLPRELHNDCMALALAKVGYLMLNAAAVAAGDDALAVMAQSHHTAYEILEHALVRLLPAAVQRDTQGYEPSRSIGMVTVSALPS